MPSATRAMGGQALDRPALEADAAAGDRLHAGDRAQQRGLAGAVGADQRDDLACAAPSSETPCSTSMRP